MPLIPHRLAQLVAQMWVFAGEEPVLWRCSHSGIESQWSIFLALLGQNPFDRICALLAIGGHIMRSVKTIVAFAAIASSIFAVSWVGLALLGF
jgi:hypothetical protein